MAENTDEKRLLKDSNLYIIFIITLMAVMGVASLAPAFPQIIAFFGISEKEVGWLIASFTLPGIFLTPVMGVLADQFGRKNILVPSLILFGLAGFSCMFIRDFQILLIFRFFQGIGAASLGSLNVTLIGDLYSGPKRIQAMGYNASVLSIGTASYPALGGILAMAGWYFPFVLPLLAIPVGIYAGLRLNNPEPESKQKLLPYLRNTWNNINQGTVWGLFFINIMVFFLIYGAYITYLPLLMESRLGSNSLFIGLMMSITSGTTAFTSAMIGKINKILNPRQILLLGSLFYIVSMLFYTLADSYWFILLPTLLFGFGQGLFIPTVQTLLVGFAPLKERAAFMSINSMVLRIGQTLGPVVIGFAYALGGLKHAYLGSALVALSMFIIIALLVKPKPQTES